MNVRRLVYGIFVFGLLAGCGTGPTIKHYQFELSAAEQSERASCQEPLRLVIEPLKISSAYDDKRIVYRESPYRLGYYHYHRWASQPEQLVTDFLRKALSEYSCFEAIESGYRHRADAVLYGRITALEEVDQTEDNWLARVEVVLKARASDTGDTFWGADYELEKKLEKPRPVHLAQGVSELLESIVQKTSPQIKSGWRDYRRQNSGSN